MGAPILYPQEIEVYYIIPTIRKYLASFIKATGKTQKEIASILHVRESTISQYTTAKRGATITFSISIQEAIKTAATRITSTLDVIRETQHILALIRTSGELCSIHKQLSPFIPQNCNIITMGCAQHLTKKEHP